MIALPGAALVRCPVVPHFSRAQPTNVCKRIIIFLFHAFRWRGILPKCAQLVGAFLPTAGQNCPASSSSQDIGRLFFKRSNPNSFKKSHDF
jgi:hypothetical protein